MKKSRKKPEKGITMIALVITTIILIILAGISINTLIGDSGIITKAKQARQNIILAGEAEAMQLNQLYYELEIGGELTEDEESSKKDEIINLLQKQVEELQKQVATLQTENEELKKQIQELTEQIANLQQEIESLKQQITNKDIEIADLKKQVSEKEAKIQELQNQLNSLNSLLSQTNATADKILSGYKAYSGGKLLTGTMANRGAVSSSLNCGGSYTIPEGYHNGSGKITANSLASQTSATATSADILTGKTAWVNGNKLTGTGKIRELHKFEGNFSFNTSGNNMDINIASIANYESLTVENMVVALNDVVGTLSGTGGAISPTVSIQSYDATKGIVRIRITYGTYVVRSLTGKYILVVIG